MTKETNTLTNIQIIEAGETYGYFKCKDPEELSDIAEEIAEDFPSIDPAFVETVLQEEIAKREEEKAKSRSRKLHRRAIQRAKPLLAAQKGAFDHVETKPKGLYVVTCAQNNTPVNETFFAALLRYVDYVGAELIICPITYNKSGFQQPAQDYHGDDLYYVEEVKPYLNANQIDLGGLQVIGNANVLPTARNPLSSFESVTSNGIDIVIPATKIALKCVAALKNSTGKVMYSTGTVTERNYIMRKAGAVAATEHNIGALVIDTRSNPPFVRQLEQMEGFDGFYDEKILYTSQGVSYNHNPAALQFGDVHAEKAERKQLEEANNLIKYYNPEHLLLHDVLDFSSRNHHNIKDPHFVFEQTQAGNTVAGDLKMVAKAVDSFVESGTEGRNVDNATTVHIVESNHDLAINTWLKNTDFKADPVNALTYLRCTTALYEHIESRVKRYFNMLQFAYKKIGKGKYADLIRFHEVDESLMIAGVEMGCHGHTGVNGSRGSPMQFRGLGIAMNTGHTHTPSICGKCYTAGVLGALDMGYNVGPGSWKHANIITYPNGQRQILFM